MCSLVPCVTLWGTTQISTPTTIIQSSVSISTPDPITSTSYTTISSGCLGNICLNVQTQPVFYTVTQTPITTTLTDTMTTTAVVTKIVPDQTLYYPCSSTYSISPTSNPQSSVDMGSTFVVGPSTTSSVSAAISVIQIQSTSSPIPSHPPLNSLPDSSSSSSTQTSQTDQSLSKTSTITLAIPAPLDSSITTTLTLPATTSHTLAADNSTSTSHATSIAGGIIGGLSALMVLFCIGWWLQKRRVAQEGEDDIAPDDEDYWERRFRELETNDEKGERHLTLDLGSHLIPDRPPSRLSTISSYFQKPRHEPTQIRSDNFSRPLRAPSFTQRFSAKWLSARTSAGGKIWEPETRDHSSNTTSASPRNSRRRSRSWSSAGRNTLQEPIETMQSPASLLPAQPPDIYFPKPFNPNRNIAYRASGSTASVYSNQPTISGKKRQRPPELCLEDSAAAATATTVPKNTWEEFDAYEERSAVTPVLPVVTSRP